MLNKKVSWKGGRRIINIEVAIVQREKRRIERKKDNKCKGDNCPEGNERGWEVEG